MSGYYIFFKIKWAGTAKNVKSRKTISRCRKICRRKSEKSRKEYFIVLFTSNLNQSVSKTSWTILSVDVWSRITFQIQESQKRILDLCFCCQIAVAQIILLFLNNQSTVINFRTSRKLFFLLDFLSKNQTEEEVTLVY